MLAQKGRDGLPRPTPLHPHLLFLLSSHERDDDDDGKMKGSMYICVEVCCMSEISVYIS